MKCETKINEAKKTRFLPLRYFIRLLRYKNVENSPALYTATRLRPSQSLTLQHTPTYRENKIHKVYALIYAFRNKQFINRIKYALTVGRGMYNTKSGLPIAKARLPAFWPNKKKSQRVCTRFFVLHIFRIDLTFLHYRCELQIQWVLSSFQVQNRIFFL